MAKKPTNPDPLVAIATALGVEHKDVLVVADVWLRHHRLEVVPGDVGLAYVAACGRLVNTDGDNVFAAVVERVKAHTAAVAAAERAAAES